VIGRIQVVSHSDNSNSVYATYPWSERGGHSNNGANAGVFASNRNTGGVNVNISSRAVQRILSQIEIK
jgi:hypothetical protein